MSVSADYNSKCLPYYCRVSSPKEKIRWLPDYGIKAGHLMKAWRKRYEIIVEKVYKEKKFRVSWLSVSVDEIKSVVNKELMGLAWLLGCRAVHLKIKTNHELNMPRDLVYTATKKILFFPCISFSIHVS